MSVSHLVVLSGLFMVAASQCSGSAQNIDSDAGTISSPGFIYNNRQTCSWKFSFTKREHQLLVLNLTNIRLYYQRWKEGKNRYYCGASLNINGDEVNCGTTKTSCIVFYNSETCLDKVTLQHLYKDCSLQEASSEMTIEFEFYGRYGTYWNYNLQKALIDYPGGFRMKYNFTNCKEETTTTLQTTTTQETTTEATTHSTTFTMQDESATDSTVKDVITTTAQTMAFKNSSSNITNTTESNNDLGKQNSENTVIIVVVCLGCLLLLIVIILAVLFIRKKKQQKESATTPGNSYEDVNYANEHDQSAITVYSVAYGNIGNDQSIYETVDDAQRSNHLQRSTNDTALHNNNTEILSSATSQPELYATVQREFDDSDARQSRKVTVRYKPNLSNEINIPESHEMVDNILYGST